MQWTNKCPDEYTYLISPLPLLLLVKGQSLYKKGRCKLNVLFGTGEHDFLVIPVGTYRTYTCSWNATTAKRVSILRDGREVASDSNSTSIQFRPVNESIHGSIISCIRVFTDGSRRYSNNTVVVTGKVVNECLL